VIEMIPQVVNRALDGQLFEHPFFRVAAILFAMIVLAGLGRTYYLKGVET